jgi:hypothetical protein
MDKQAQLSPPPKPVPNRHRYAAHINRAITNPGEWIAIPACEISGKSAGAKQNRILQAARVRGLRVQTTFQVGHLYLRLVVPAAPDNEVSQ